MQLWRTGGGKRIVITEGEIDAMSYAQATGLTWPVVSPPNGVQSAKKALSAHIEELEKYDQVVLLFDNDEAGRTAALECAELFTPGKCFVASYPNGFKDANEMLVAGKTHELLRCVWEAREFRPDGVINGADIWDLVSAPVQMGTPYPWTGFNRLLYGLRPGEIVTLTSGTGIGKSTVCAEIAYHLAQTCGQTVGYVALEENVGRSGLRFMGINLNKPLHLPGHEIPIAERQAAFTSTLGTGRYYFYDHFGSLQSDNLLSRLRYLAIGCGCKWLILDHLSIVVSGMDLGEDERRALDYTMTALRSFTEQTGCGLILVSHLKRVSGASNRGHEDGAQISLSHLRSSQAIAQLSDAVIGIERDQQAGEDANIATGRVLKNRYAGLTGVACKLKFDKETHRLTEVIEDFDEQDEDALSEDALPWNDKDDDF